MASCSEKPPEKTVIQEKENQNQNQKFKVQPTFVSSVTFPDFLKAAIVLGTCWALC